eukprot:TRINITY_DN11001_c0_g1_i1.p2 TRINITY_DN11001_c0_g1~~TRINITY_DN11001_c0_g1_i1.p2  ORF type:complete len:124 (-),score=17.57 TRINITY_DN11001_c0_g1_i1:113-442(-)
MCIRDRCREVYGGSVYAGLLKGSWNSSCYEDNDCQLSLQVLEVKMESEGWLRWPPPVFVVFGGVGVVVILAIIAVLVYRLPKVRRAAYTEFANAPIEGSLENSDAEESV